MVRCLTTTSAESSSSAVSGRGGGCSTVLGDALAGRMRLAMVSGEAGIGKTALVAAVADDASDDATVCWGTCWHGAGAPGYWPWTQALDALAAAVGRDLAAELAGEDRELLATIAPALGPATDLGDQGTFLLFDAVARCGRVGRTPPAGRHGAR